MLSLPGTNGRRRLYLMRHGHVDYISAALQGVAIEEVPLTELGREQAEAAGQALSHVAFDRAVSSDLIRARETAEIVLSKQDTSNGTALATDASLREIKGGGKIRGEITSRRDLVRLLNERFDKAHEPGARISPDGEPFADAMARGIGAIETLLNDRDWHTALIVAHEGINRLILSWATGAGLLAVGGFEQDTACVNVIDFDGEMVEDGHVIRRRIIKAVNLTPYNYVKHGMNLTSLETIFALD